MADIPFSVLNPPERERVYYFSNGTNLYLKNVTKIEVRPSGKHRIETADGEKFIVAPTWDYIRIETDEWTF